MNIKQIVSILITIAFIAGGIYFYTGKTNRKEVVYNLQNTTFDPKNASYKIEGNIINLVNGESQIEVAPNSASKIITRYFGNDAKGDLNGDGQEDTAYLITQEGGGSGLFYYAVAVIKAGNEFKITEAFLIGDRIAPQSTEIREMTLYINYADRKPGEPMTAQPSVGFTKFLKVAPDGKLIDIKKIMP